MPLIQVQVIKDVFSKEQVRCHLHLLAGRAEDATQYFRIPPDRVVEVGTQVMV